MPAYTGPQLWQRYRHRLEMVGRRPNTIKTYRKCLYAFWGFTGKMEEPRTVTKKDLERFLSRVSEGPRAKGRPLARKTVLVEGKSILVAYRWFAENSLLGRRNPFIGYDLPKGLDLPPRYLEPEQVARLLDKAEACADDRMATAIWLAYGAGLRCCELASLRIEDIRPARSGRPMTILVEGKGGHAGVVPVANAGAAAWLERYLATQPPSGPLLATRDGGGHPAGRPLTAHTISTIVGRFMHDNGIKESVHVLRHTFATELVMAGGNLRGVQKLLRHKSITTTERYTANYDGDAWAVAALLPDPRKVGQSEAG
jgi:site-specific recombinase XerD